MASRALTARLSTQLSSWLASTWISQIPPASTVSIMIVSARVRRSISDTPLMSAFTETGFGCSGWRREKARSCWVRMAAREEAISAEFTSWRRAASSRSASRRCNVSRLPPITVSRLLKSCATPPVSCPTASSFCDWRARSSASRFSVRSRVILAKPSSRPCSSRIACRVALAQNRLPSLRTRQPSSSCRPADVALAISRPGTPRARSSGV